MKPDLGLRYVQEGYGEDVAILFYDVRFDDIDFISPQTYSVMFERHYAGITHALSFDFSDEILAQIVAKLPSAARKMFVASIRVSSFPFRSQLPAQVVAKVVECRLGKLQRGAYEEFVPFVINRIE